MKKGLFGKGLVFGIIVLFVGAGVIPSTVGIKKEMTTVLSIDSGGYIQDLIDNASDGDTIYIPSGIYNENNIVINKSISLIGEDRNTTIIDGNLSDFIINVTADWVNISGFTIRNGGYYYQGAGIILTSDYNTIKNNNLCFNVYSIILENSNNNIISYNNINESGFGLFFFKSSNNTISANNINCYWGIVIEHQSNYNNIFYNNISNGHFSISFESSNNNIIMGNIISNNSYGLRLGGSSKNNISRNDIINTNNYGVKFYHSSQNIICKNNISNNEAGIYLEKSSFNLLRNNIIVNSDENNFGIDGESIEHFIQDIDISNTINGKPIYYWLNIENAEIPLDAAYVGLVNCTNINIKNLSLKENNYQAILLANTHSSTIYNNSISNNYYGIFVFSSSYNNITSNNILSNKWYGIGFRGSSNNNTIFNNTISEQESGIIESSYNNILGNTITNHDYGIAYSSNDNIKDNIIFNNAHGLNGGSYNIITSNNISNNYCGIYWPFDKNFISGNTISKNAYGIRVYFGWYNIITKNNITSNSIEGIWLYSSQRNKIYHNNFINNTKNSGFYDNQWDDGYPSGGNYWDDYTGVDNNHGHNQDIQGHDRIGDTPYIIGTNQDNYPLMQPYDWMNHIPENITFDGPTSGVAGEELTYTVLADDPDGEPIYYLFDWGDGTNSSWFGPYPSGVEGSGSHSWKKGTYSIKVKAKDTRGLESDWSDSLSITIPRNRMTFNSMFFGLLELLLERFPLLERLLSFLLL